MFSHKTLPLWPLPLILAGVLGVLSPPVILGAIVLAVAPLLITLKRPKPPAVLGAPLLLFVASAFLGLGAAYDPALSLPMVLTILGSALCFFSMVYAGVDVAEAVAKGLVIISGLLSLYFVAQYDHINYPNETGMMAHIARATSSLMPDWAFFAPHPNAVAGLVGGVLLLSVALALHASSPKIRLLWSVPTLLLMYALLVTGSRGMWLGLLVAAAVGAVLFMPGWAQRVIGLGAGITVGLIAGAFVVVQVAPAHLVPNNFIENTVGPVVATGISRFTLYQNSYNLFWDYPYTGIGPGDTFAMVYSRFQLLINVPYLEYAHNLFLAVAVGQGILGLCALLWLLGRLYLYVYRVERIIDSAEIPWLFRAAWLGVTAILIHGLTDAVQFSAARWTTPVFFALMGLIVATGQPFFARKQAGRHTTALQIPPIASGALLAALLITGLTLAIFWRPLLGAAYANLGAIYQTKADLSPHFTDNSRNTTKMQAKKYFEQALETQPQNLVAHRRLGMMALDDDAFQEAIGHLEQAYSQEPDNQATLKALGYAYLWDGQMEKATALFEQVNFQQRLLQELEHWQWQRSQRKQEPLSTYATEMLQRLTDK